MLLLAVALLAPSMAFGQAYFGTVTGLVTDPSGAVIAGAKLTLTDQEKGYSFNEKENPVVGCRFCDRSGISIRIAILIHVEPLLTSL